MSALPAKADIQVARINARFVPIADIVPLFDHLVGKPRERRRHAELQRTHGIELP
jgi:hypothetical protein